MTMTYLKARGWTTHVAALGHFKLTLRNFTEIRQGVIEWDRVDIDDLYWSHTAHLLILQGAPLQQIFGDCSLYVEGERTPHIGPFVYLKGDIAEPQDPPPRAENVVLARIISRPKDALFMDVFGALLKELKLTLRPPFSG